MTTLDTRPTTRLETAAPGSRFRRFAALARGETTILLRNRTAIFTAVAMPFVVGLAFFGMSQDRAGLPVVQNFYDRNGIAGLPIWLDPRGAAGRAFGIPGLPTTIILDRQGREIARLIGAAAWDTPDAIAAVRNLLPRPPAGAETTVT